MHIHDYLERLHYAGPLEPTLQTLQALHEAHLLSIPFENLNIHLGRRLLLDEDALWTKIIEQRRGGFCYELNGLFAWLLRTLGFQVSLLAADVARPAGGFGPEFDHLALLVHLEDDWLADVGFGESFRQPLQMQASLVQVQEWGKYRLEREGTYWLLQSWDDEEWKPSYRFTLHPHVLSEFNEMCQYHQTDSLSHFTQRRICTIATRIGRTTLSDKRLIMTVQKEKKTQQLTSQEEYTAALAEHFGIVL
ncbi:MAG TPA: arylamine N-acetyltransferase [Ktedonobacteraceae bacterium]|nr:arylamine N-acetyltransferase [Ktedonobacteraceae bacterium]